MFPKEFQVQKSYLTTDSILFCSFLFCFDLFYSVIPTYSVPVNCFSWGKEAGRCAYMHGDWRMFEFVCTVSVTFPERWGMNKSNRPDTYSITQYKKAHRTDHQYLQRIWLHTHTHKWPVLTLHITVFKKRKEKKENAKTCSNLLFYLFIYFFVNTRTIQFSPQPLLSFLCLFFPSLSPFFFLSLAFWATVWQPGQPIL